MPELRKDPIVGRWVIIATQRAQRPFELSRPSEAPQGGLCPFCPGHEDKTPPEVFASGRAAGAGANSPGWAVRVVPNRYPALMVEGELARKGEGLYDKMNGVGAHEVIIETPAHQKTLADLSDGEVTDVLKAFKARLLDLPNDLRFRYILLFKNHGSAAGASLTHSHSQLIALPVVPIQVLEEIRGAEKHYEAKERCIFCDIVDQEQRDRVRLIAENEAFVAFAPWAPKSPFETWIVGKNHESRFAFEPEERLASFASLLRDTLRRLGAALGNPAYNFMIHTNPLRDPPSPSYHWHVEIVPALTQVAGFEWGSGFFINPVPPEEAAEFMRNVR